MGHGGRRDHRVPRRGERRIALDDPDPPSGKVTTEDSIQPTVRARRHGLDPTRMAPAWVTSRPFTTSSIIGATTLVQLEQDLARLDLALPETVLAEIEAIHRRQPSLAH